MGHAPGLLTAAVIAALALTGFDAAAAPYAHARQDDARETNAQNAEHVVQYRLFREAQDRGDFDAAAVHGEAAWKAAEEILGDHELTAVLAYNFGYHIVFVLPEQAKPALERAKALADAGLAQLPDDMLGLLLTYSEFAASDATRESIRETRRYLIRYSRNGSPPTEELARFWLAIAGAQSALKLFRDAAKSAERADEIYTEAGLS